MSEIPPARYEQSDVTARSALIAFPLVLLGLLAAIFLARWMFPYAAIDRRLPSTPPEYPAPRLQANPQADMARFLKGELERLNSSGWDDGAHTKGHIQIDEAMRRIAANGIPDWPK